MSLHNVKLHDSSYKSKYTLPANIHVSFEALRMQSLNMLIYEVVTQQKERSVVASEQYFVCVRYV